jgi:hypothetical protein
MRSIGKRVASIAKVSVLIWVALLLVLTTAGAFHVFLRVRAFLRTFKTFGQEVGEGARRLTRSFDRLARDAETVGSSKPRLDASLARLNVSLARLNVLRAAVQDVQDSVGRLAAVYPRK